MKVDVYWNLHKKLWSVRHKGKVIAHRKNVLVENAKFVVQPAGRERVRREGRKNVHAFVRGDINAFFWIAGKDLKQVRYNPYEMDSFQFADGSPAKVSDWVELTPEGKCYARRSDNGKS